MKNKNLINKIILGNCLEVMKGIEDKSIDLVLTDPPYGMDFQSNHRKVKHKKIENDISLDWLDGYIRECFRILKKDTHLYCFCSWHKLDIFKQTIEKHFSIKNILIWEKNNTGMGDLKGAYASKTEFCIFAVKGQRDLNGRRDPDIIKDKKTGNIYHPTQKPTGLFEYFIEKSTNKGDVVFDGFMGSGTTAVSAVNTKRRFIGIEQEQEYVDISRKRIADAQAEPKLFY